jgi:putative sterol carrier protein
MGIARLLVPLAAAALCASAAAAPVMMSSDWAKEACEAWNRDPVLTDKLVESGWVKNDKGRGYKVMQVYRSDCGDKPTAEMRVSQKEGKAACTYGGAPETATLDSGADYVMKAETVRWTEMGKGEYGPMRAMMTGRLGFDGPMFEAMGNMGPFENFLLLVGKVPSDTAACPAK